MEALRTFATEAADALSRCQTGVFPKMTACYTFQVLVCASSFEFEKNEPQLLAPRVAAKRAFA
jgi:hypothetical protein